MFWAKIQSECANIQKKKNKALKLFLQPKVKLTYSLQPKKNINVFVGLPPVIKLGMINSKILMLLVEIVLY